MDTRASTMPLTTHGKELRGAMRTLNREREVKAMPAVRLWPSSTNRPKVNRDMRMGVAAQK